MTEHRAFSEFSRGIREPLLLVKADGLIVSVNEAASAGQAAMQPGAHLQALFSDPKNKLIRFLRFCRRTASPLPGSFHCRHENRVCDVLGWRYQPEPSSPESLVVLRIQQGSEMRRSFEELNNQIDSLKAEIQAREKAEKLRLQRIMQEQQTQRLESLAVMAGGMSHDFNNILTTISGHAELAMKEAEAGSSLAENLSAVIDGARRAAEVSGRLLAYTGHYPLKRSHCDLSDLIAASRDVFEIVTTRHCRLVLDLAPRLPAISCDPDRIRQVLVDLVINASEAIGDKEGEITVCACPCADQPDRVELSVTDNGCGIEATQLATIFDPFVSTKFTGRGLGLAAAQGIIQVHGGSISVESEPGLGSCFRIVLPVASLP